MEIWPILMNTTFNFCDKNNYELRIGTHLARPILNTTQYGTESIPNLGAKIWDLAQ